MLILLRRGVASGGCGPAPTCSLARAPRCRHERSTRSRYPCTRRRTCKTHCRAQSVATTKHSTVFLISAIPRFSRIFDISSALRTSTSISGNLFVYVSRNCATTRAVRHPSSIPLPNTGSKGLPFLDTLSHCQQLAIPLHKRRDRVNKSIQLFLRRVQYQGQHASPGNPETAF